VSSKGRRIKLKDYTEFSDYKKHENQIGVIIEEIKETYSKPNSPYVNFDFRVQWKDGGISRVSASNVVFQKPTTLQEAIDEAVEEIKNNV
jgi:hypothetical protein